MYNKHNVKHMITSVTTNNTQDKFDLCHKYLQNYGFKDLNDIRNKYNPIVEYIKEL